MHFLIKLDRLIYNFIKKATLAKEFSCGFYEIFKNICTTEHLWATTWVFTISREVSHYTFLYVVFFNKKLSKKIFEDIFVMLAAKDKAKNMIKT